MDREHGLEHEEPEVTMGNCEHCELTGHTVGDDPWWLCAWPWGTLPQGHLVPGIQMYLPYSLTSCKGPGGHRDRGW